MELRTAGFASPALSYKKVFQLLYIIHDIVHNVLTYLLGGGYASFSK